MEEEIISWESPLDIEMIDSEKEGNFCIARVVRGRAQNHPKQVL
jgi:hypothetical protein